MAAHSVFCSERDGKCLLPSLQLFGGVHRPEKWLIMLTSPHQSKVYCFLFKQPTLLRASRPRPPTQSLKVKKFFPSEKVLKV